MPHVVTFSPICPADTAKPAIFSSSCSSEWIRCTWRRLGWLGSRATRERCLTVAPECASPSTPRPARRRMDAPFGLVSVCAGLELTAVTVPFIDRLPFPGRSAAERTGSWREQGTHLFGEPGEIGQGLRQAGRGKAEEEVHDAGAHEAVDVRGDVGGSPRVELAVAV